MIALSRHRWLLLVALALGLTVMFHGCHGPDEDHELLMPRVILMK